MKQFIRMFITLTLLCTVFLSGVRPAKAAEAIPDLEEVFCEEQGFSTRIPDGCSAAFEDGNGLRISVGTPGYVPYVLVWKWGRSDVDPDAYFEEFTADMKESYGSRLVSTMILEYQEIGGRKLPAASYTYNTDGGRLTMMRLIEPHDGFTVEYTAKFTADTEEATMEALDAAVRYFQAETEGGSPESEPLTYCEAQDFSLRIPDGLPAVWEEGKGLFIYTGKEGYVPYVQVWRRGEEAKLNNPLNYVNNVYREHMEDTYGDALHGGTFYDSYEIGGKSLIGAKYTYDTDDATLCLIHLVEVRDGGDVEYFAKFVEGEGDPVMEVLDMAVGSYTEGKASEAPGKEDEPKPQEISIDTILYEEPRFTMTIPAGWQVLTTGEYSVFSVKIWDPECPDRSIFFMMKMEPFLKSQAAKDKYKEVADATGGDGSLYAIYSRAPVMEEPTLPAFLKAIPGTIDFCNYYYSSGVALNPAVIPDIMDVTAMVTTDSPLPCPSTCRDNSIAGILYENSRGQTCEGILTAQPVDTMSYDFFGLDGWFYSVYLFEGFTTPEGEMEALMPVLSDCLGSFAFTDSYVADALKASEEEKKALEEQGKLLEASHDAIMNAWNERIAAWFAD